MDDLNSTETACGDATPGKALGLGGNNNNGHSIVFAISTTDIQDIILYYDFKRNNYGFKTATWAHSTDGSNFTIDTIIRDESSYSSTASCRNIIIDFSNATDINNQETVYIRLTVDESTGASGNNRYDNVLITGTTDMIAAEKPDFSVDPGKFCVPFEVTMSSETENASIYYTLDGSDPDKMNGTLYEGPVTINSTCILRAKAYADGLSASIETSASYTFPTEVATISALKSLSNNTYCKLTCPVTAVFQNTNYLFVEDDAHTGLCIRRQSSFTSNYLNGDIITDGICGTRSVNQNIIEMSSPEFINPTATQGTAIEPVAVTMTQLRINWDTYDSRLVTLSNVTFEQGNVGANTSSYLKIYQGSDSLGCTNTFGTITGYTAPLSTANVTGFALNNSIIKRIAPRNVSDIVDLLPSITIVSPTEGLDIEQGTPLQVELDINNFNFENESMIECELLVNGETVSTQYLHNGSELTEFENTDISSLITFGECTVIVSLVDADTLQFPIPATDTVHFTYSAIYIAIETSESALEFTETDESHTFTVTGFRLDEAIALTVDNDAFTVSPATLPASANAETVTVTFTGDASAKATLTLTSGTTVATVALNAVLPIDELIFSVGFEPNEGFTSTSAFQNDNPKYLGPDGQKWGVVHGCVTNAGPISGTQSMQMKYYCEPTDQHYGHIGYTFTDFDVHNVTKVEFDAKVSTSSNMKLKVSFSHDGGETYEGDSIFNTTASPQHFTYNITDSGQYYSVRVKFTMVLPEVVTQTDGILQLIIDAVDFYGVTGLEPNIVETPVISESSGMYPNPITVSITCETEGASIYYTTDGTTPNESSNRYDAPLTINSACTLKAKAYKGGMEPSNSASAEYNFPIEVATIADFKEAGANNNSLTYKITGDVTFVYRDTRRIFIEDATGGLLVLDKSTPVVTGSYNEGDVISGGIIGTYTVFTGMQEMIPSFDWAEASDNVTVTPTVVTTADIMSDFATYEARLVRINAGIFTEDASFNTSNYTEATFTDSVGEILFRNQFLTLDTVVNAGDSVDVIGLVSIFVSGGTITYQLLPRTNADIIPIIPEPEDTSSIDIHTLDPILLTVYPNPATDVITINADHNGGSLEVINAFGQVVYRAKAPVYPMTVDMSNKAAGLYFVRVITADQRVAVVKVSKK